MFFKIGALKSITVFTEKHLCWSLFLMRLQGFRPYKNSYSKICFEIGVLKNFATFTGKYLCIVLILSSKQNLESNSLARLWVQWFCGNSRLTTSLFICTNVYTYMYISPEIFDPRIPLKLSWYLCIHYFSSAVCSHASFFLMHQNAL